MHKLTTPRILLINFFVVSLGLLVWNIPFSSLLSNYYLNRGVAESLVNGMGSQGSIEYFLRAAAVDPGNYDAQYWLGTVYYQEQEYEKAAKHFKAYLDITPLNADIFFYLGESNFNLGQYDSATAAYSDAIRLDPRNISFLEVITERYKMMNRDVEYFNSLYQLASLTPDTTQRSKYSSDMAEILEKTQQQIPIQTGSPLGFGRQTSVASSMDGTLFLLSRSLNYPNLIIVSSSADKGKTWTVIRLLDVIYEGSDADGALTVDAKGVVHLFYGIIGGKSLYTNSDSNFDTQLLVSEDGDSRQIGADSSGRIHLVWNGGESSIFHAEVYLEKIIGMETVATGTFPSLAIDGEKPIVTYNLDVTFPNQRGGVFISEKINGQWSTGEKISREDVWAGASVAGVFNGHIYVLYIEDADIHPILVLARRDGTNHWEISEADETYIPYIPQGLPFGGRTAPGIKVTDTHVYLLWRSGLEASPIILKSIDIMDQNTDDIQILGELGDEPFSASPSFVMDFSHPESVGVLWKQNGQPVVQFR